MHRNQPRHHNSMFTFGIDMAIRSFGPTESRRQHSLPPHNPTVELGGAVSLQCGDVTAIIGGSFPQPLVLTDRQITGRRCRLEPPGLVTHFVRVIGVAIRSIRHGGLRRWFVHRDASKLHPAHAESIKQILDALDDASPLDDLG